MISCPHLAPPRKLLYHLYTYFPFSLKLFFNVFSSFSQNSSHVLFASTLSRLTNSRRFVCTTKFGYAKKKKKNENRKLNGDIRHTPSPQPPILQPLMLTIDCNYSNTFSLLVSLFSPPPHKGGNSWKKYFSRTLPPPKNVPIYVHTYIQRGVHFAHLAAVAPVAARIYTWYGAFIRI